jgi:hypothetical protein
VKGTAEFYDDLTLPSSFKVTDKPPTGILPGTKSSPSLAGGTGSISHDIKAAWDCCSKDKVPTRQTKVTATGDPSEATRRKMSLVQLVRRDVVPGTTTVGTFARLLQGAQWPGEGNVTVITAIAGKVPVTWSPEDTALAIALPGGSGAIHLSIAGRFAEDEIVATLRETVARPARPFSGDPGDRCRGRWLGCRSRACHGSPQVARTSLHLIILLHLLGVHVHLLAHRPELLAHCRHAIFDHARHRHPD